MENFGHYTILEPLRTGALGELSRARDARLGRTVALRLASAEVTADPARRDALLAGAAVAGSLSHPHIAALFDFGEHDGRIFLAHEFIPGQPLHALLSAKPFDPSLALELAVQLADAVAEGHRHGVVHGDIRPSTIFLTPTDQAKIIGFGLAEWSTGGIERRQIVEDLSAGCDPSTPNAAVIVPYMSPEQVLGGAGDARSDVFSLAVVLYEMLTGRLPFGSDTPGKTAVKILYGTQLPPSRQNPGLAAGFDGIFVRALSKSLEARYPSAIPLAADLRALAGQLNLRVTAELQHAAPAAPPKPRRTIPKRLVASVLGVLLVGGLAGLGWMYGPLVRRALFRPAPISNPVIVVLPFGGAQGADRAYFGIGFAEDLASRLGEVPGMTVAGRADIGAGAQVPLADRARSVGARLALRGNATPGPYSLKVDVELVEAATGKVLWSERYSREPRKAAAVEAEIARDLADRLGLEMPTGNRWARALTRDIDPGAFEFYLQARDASSHRDRAKAISLYRQALGIDTVLIEARVGLSEALNLEDFYSGAGGETDALARAREEADAALAVDPEMPRAHLVAALSAPTPVAAASSVAKALSLDPSSGEAWHHAGDLLIELDPARAIDFYRRSLELEPANDANFRDLGAAYEMLAKLPEAEEAVARGRSVRPDRPWWTQLAARFEIVRTNYAGAAGLVAASTATETTPSAWLYGSIVPLRMADRKADSRAAVTRLLERFPGYCEATAIQAGFDWDDNAKDKARAAAAAIFERASGSDAKAGTLQCAVTAAAAIGDAPEAAGLLARMAGDDRALRIWTRQTVFNPALAFRLHLYPFDKMQASGPFAQATAVLAENLRRLRDETIRRLPTPPKK